MRKIFLLVLFLSCLTAIGQTYYPPFAVAGQNPSGTLVFVGTDASGNLYTNGTGSSGAPTVVSGYIPPVAMTGQNPSGVQVYLKTDANGNLYVNCQTGCSGGGGGGYTLQIAGVSLTASDTVNFNASTPAAGSNGINVTFQTSKASTTDSVSAEIVGDGTSTHYLSGVGTWTTPSGGSGTVTSIIFSAPLTGGTVTTTGTVGCTTCVTSSSPGAGLAHFAGSTQAVTSSAVSLSADVSGNLPNANLATQTANTVLGALTATTPSGLAMPSCSGASNALTWTTSTGFGCNTISGGGGSAFPETVSGTTTSGGIPYFSNTTTLTSSAILNSNILIKGGGGGGAPTNSSITDNGTSVTTTDTGGYVGAAFTANGSTAGFFDYPQGSTSAAVAPCNVANSICVQAPTSVTAYLLDLPAAQPAANNNFIFCTAANPTVCSFAQVLWSELGNAGGALTLANGTNATTFNQTSAVNWTWANTTAATVSLNNPAPIFNLLGQAWEGGSLANTTDGFTIQSAFCNNGSCPSNANNPYPTLIIQDAITASTHYPSVTLQGANFFYNPNTHSSNIGGGLVSGTGSYSIAIGNGTLQAEGTGNGNGSGDVVIGYNSMTNADGDGSNVVIGYSSGNSCYTCSGNVLVGPTGSMGNSSYGVGVGYSESLGSYTAVIEIGVNGSATGNYDINLGYGNSTTGANDIVLGQGISVATANEVAIGNSSITDDFFNGMLHSAGFQSGGGTKFSVTGCGTATSLTGGSTAGQFVGGSATCTPVITTNLTASHGYSCSIQDQTTATALFQQTANTTTTITFTAGGVVGATDTINFACTAF